MIFNLMMKYGNDGDFLSVQNLGSLVIRKKSDNSVVTGIFVDLLESSNGTLYALIKSSNVYWFGYSKDAGANWYLTKSFPNGISRLHEFNNTIIAYGRAIKSNTTIILPLYTIDPINDTTWNTLGLSVNSWSVLSFSNKYNFFSYNSLASKTDITDSNETWTYKAKDWDSTSTATDTPLTFIINDKVFVTSWHKVFIYDINNFPNTLLKVVTLPLHDSSSARNVLDMTYSNGIYYFLISGGLISYMNDSYSASYFPKFFALTAEKFIKINNEIFLPKFALNNKILFFHLKDINTVNEITTNLIPTSVHFKYLLDDQNSKLKLYNTNITTNVNTLYEIDYDKILNKIIKEL